MIQVFGIIWNHVQTDEFVTFGKNHTMFWSTDGGKLKKTRGLYGKRSRESFFCGTFSENGYCITGAQNGTLYVWKGRKAVKTIDVHKGHSNGELCALNLSISNPKEFITAGEDNEIAVWNMEEHKLLRNAILDAEKGPKRKRRRAGTTSTAPPNRCARTVVVEPTNGDQLAVGLNSGWG
eukprot:148848_1